MKKEYHLFLDLLFYFILPILFWELGRGYISDYPTILISVFPGIFYSLYRFFKTNDITFTRIYLFINIIVGLLCDLCAGSALQLLWNDMFYSLGLSLIFIGSSLTQRPLFFYLSLDILVMQGYDRKLTREILLKKNSMTILRVLSILNGVRELIFMCFLLKCLPIYGIEIYTVSILLDQLFSLCMSGISIVGYYFLYKYVNNITVVHQLPRKNTGCGLFQYLMENGYFFLRKHFL